MQSGRERPPAHMRLLLAALTNAAGCESLDPGQWDLLVRTARAGRLLGVVAARLDAAGKMPAVPVAVAAHLHAALAEAAYLRQMMLRELTVVAETLRPLGCMLVALKGAAYILDGRRCAAGRLPRDLDIMVPRERLDEVEQALLAAGWSFEKTDPYDQRYYRDWSHELPPLRAPTLPLELDVHHTILPPLGRLRPSAQALFEASVAAAGSPWRTLAPADQVLHAAAHLFQDSDCIGRLRDLVDIDSLVRQAVEEFPGFPAELARRAHLLELGGPLWHALQAARAWLLLPIDAAACGLRPPAWAGRSVVGVLARRCLTIVDPDGGHSLPDRLAHQAMTLRANWLRMPPHMLAFHAANKAVRRFRGGSAKATAG
jgi:hypothetical protein